jgi:hypothetical protein
MLHFCCGILQVDSNSTDTINAVINNACSVGNLIVKTAWAVTQATLYISGARIPAIIANEYRQNKHSPQQSSLL